jgi:hypothetical protein
MRRNLIYASAGFGLLMYTIDAAVAAVAFRHFMRELHANLLLSSIRLIFLMPAERKVWG